MTDIAPPQPGQNLWADDLNTYLLSLEARIAANEARFDTHGTRLTALENKPEHIYNSYGWKFSNDAPPALSTEVRLNNVNAALATLIDIRMIDIDGADRRPVFQQVSLDTIIRINDWDDASKLHRYRVTSPVTMDDTNAQIPVAWESGNGTLPTGGNAKVNVAFLLTLMP